MHIYFSGIGGTAIGPLALIAQQAGYQVSGSDKQDSQYIEYLKKHGLGNIHIGQTYDQIAAIHNARPIDWYLYSSAVAIEQPDAPELQFCQENSLKVTKRDELLNKILQDQHLKMLAIAGTHGKSTTTSMVIWLFKELGLPVSYSVGAKISFGDMGQYQKDSEYFVYECDEFDRNFLAFQPYRSLITGVSWDHHEIFKTRQDYQQAFRDFIDQGELSYMWPKDISYLDIDPENPKVKPLETGSKQMSSVTLPGQATREDAWLAIQAVQEVTAEPLDKLVAIINNFPGLQRRMEQIVSGLFSDYAHTPEKIRGGLSVAFDLAAQGKDNTAAQGEQNIGAWGKDNLGTWGEQNTDAESEQSIPTQDTKNSTKSDNKEVVVVYEPLTDRRQHHMLNDYKDCFKGVKKVYWIPSYLAREDSTQAVLSPSELISHLSDPSIAESRPAPDQSLKDTIQQHLDCGDMVVCMTGGGGGSLDEWLRAEFQP